MEVAIDMKVAMEVDIDMKMDMKVAMEVDIDIKMDMKVAMEVDIDIKMDMKVAMEVDIDIKMDMKVAMEVDIDIKMDMKVDMEVDIDIKMDMVDMDMKGGYENEGEYEHEESAESATRSHESFHRWVAGFSQVPCLGQEFLEYQSGAGVPPGAIIITAIFTNNFTAIITSSSPRYEAV
ncbi:hypothetical protein TRIUR3_35045 [Triticum urartu]|uniref:Uncharacterized protein n=1 Tax=Triticum urartu TaxID=4572 RepID=M7ZF40_TRIUA|nr:hypothetical protein TRIUR3_35045 [Triticum urartu]